MEDSVLNDRGLEERQVLLPTPICFLCPPPSLLPPPPPTVNVNVTVTIIPQSSTTITSLVTIAPTIITTTFLTTISTDVISTVTETTLSITPLPNPANTAALAAQSSLLSNNATLSRTNITVSLVLGTLTFILLLLALILFILYIRRRRRSSSDDESPPFTSLAPRPAPIFPTSGGRLMTPPSRIGGDHMHETSLSMGPRGGPADSYISALAITPSPSRPPPSRPINIATSIPLGAGYQTQARTALASHPPTPTRVRRSASAPVEAPEPAPKIPPFGELPSINILPNTPSASASDIGRMSPGSAGGSGAGASSIGGELRRQRSVPMYHAALTEQVQRERERTEEREAERLGVPVIGIVKRDRGSVSSESEISFEEEKREVGGSGAGGGNGRERVLHSTRASSGVFPEVEGEEDGREIEGKDVYS